MASEEKKKFDCVGTENGKTVTEVIEAANLAEAKKAFNKKHDKLTASAVSPQKAE